MSPPRHQGMHTTTTSLPLSVTKQNRNRMSNYIGRGVLGDVVSVQEPPASFPPTACEQCFHYHRKAWDMERDVTPQQSATESLNQSRQ